MHLYFIIHTIKVYRYRKPQQIQELQAFLTVE